MHPLRENEFHRIGGPESGNEVKPLKLMSNKKGSFPILSESVKGVAHDMRNFLSAISGYLELIKMEPGQDDLIDDALESVEMASKLNLQLLNPGSRGWSKVDIATLIEKIAAVIIGPSESKYELYMCSKPQTIVVDELLLERALQNILVNSIQAMPKGGTISISTCIMEQGEIIVPSLVPGKYIQISIKDTGKGIPQEYIDMIMKPYFTTKEKGMGLGLAITKEIISSLNGTIEIASEKGFGTVTVIYLPI
jgi:signal transduction histidine kinase